MQNEMCNQDREPMKRTRKEALGNLQLWATVLRLCDESQNLTLASYPILKEHDEERESPYL